MKRERESLHGNKLWKVSYICCHDGQDRMSIDLDTGTKHRRRRVGSQWLSQIRNRWSVQAHQLSADILAAPSSKFLNLLLPPTLSP